MNIQQHIMGIAAEPIDMTCQMDSETEQMRENVHWQVTRGCRVRNHIIRPIRMP
jgi:hypothetical protein